MTNVLSVGRADSRLLAALEALDDGGLDRLGFGVIGFDAETRICRYNHHESRGTGLTPSDVLGHQLFTDIAQCMNNYLVAQRFEDASAAGEPLDATIDYVLTWRIKPCKVTLRMLSDPAVATRYLVLHRLS